MTQSSPVLSTPEASVEGMIGPGQQSILDEFVAEQEAQQQAEEQQKILGKFNSVEELARSYQELEKKLGQGGAKPAPAAEPEAAAQQPQPYTAEMAAEVYGQEAVETLAEKGVDLADLMWQADQGKDVSNHFDTLAEVFKVPRQVVENYVGKAQAKPSAPSSDGLSEADVAELKAAVGGDEAFSRLQQWGASNMDPQELAAYNAAVDSGNKDAVRWALKALAARAQSPANNEPKLIGGGKPPVTERFESRQQVLDAMNKTNSRGQRLYDTDEAYRAKFVAILANSEVF